MCARAVCRALSASSCGHTRDAMGLYYAKHHSRTANQAIATPFKNASIIAKEYSYVKRRILEAMIIRDRCPRVNRDCGWVLQLIDHA